MIMRLIVAVMRISLDVRGRVSGSSSIMWTDGLTPVLRSQILRKWLMLRDLYIVVEDLSQVQAALRAGSVESVMDVQAVLRIERVEFVMYVRAALRYGSVKSAIEFHAALVQSVIQVHAASKAGDVRSTIHSNAPSR